MKQIFFYFLLGMISNSYSGKNLKTSLKWFLRKNKKKIKPTPHDPGPPQVKPYVAAVIPEHF
jgi:hypothetical protein